MVISSLRSTIEKKSTFLASVSLGLAGSSCCILQLSLILLAEIHIIEFVGCAGFNKFFGPFRTHVRVLTFCFWAYKWISHFFIIQNRTSRYFEGKKTEPLVTVSKDSSNSSKSTALSSSPPSSLCCTSSQSSNKNTTKTLLYHTIVCLSLTFLPEVLKVTTQHTDFKINRGGLAVAPSMTNLEKKSYTVDNMGCESCLTHVHRTVEGTDGVVGVSFLDFETAQVEFWISGDWNFDEDVLAKRLDVRGYELLPAGSKTKKMEMDEKFQVRKGLGGNDFRSGFGAHEL